MKKLVLVSAFVIACGGGSSSNGGGPLSGTIGGRAFTPVEVKAIITSATADPCTVPQIGAAGIRGMAIEATSYAGACGDYTSATCQVHASAQSVTVIFALLDPSGAVPQIRPGTFPIRSSFTQIDVDNSTGSLLWRVVYAQSLATGPATPAPGCAGSPATAVSGTLRVDQVTGSAVTGYLTVTFEDGSSAQGDFTAPLCPTAPDVCTLATEQQFCTPPTACVP